MAPKADIDLKNAVLKRVLLKISQACCGPTLRSVSYFLPKTQKHDRIPDVNVSGSRLPVATHENMGVPQNPLQ